MTAIDIIRSNSVDLVNHVSILGFTDVFLKKSTFVRPGQAESGFCFPMSHQDLWEQYQGRKDNPYFTMIKLFGGGGRFAKQHPELLLLNKDDERETHWRNGACFYTYSEVSCNGSTQNGWFIIYNRKSYLNA